jgi:DNA-binding transcriptional MerR regulator
MPLLRRFAAVLMNYAVGALPPDDQPIYSIGAVERMVDIPAATIRNWEQRYGLIAPERSQGGHRLYARRQVEQLRFVKRELDAGLQPAEAHRLLADTIAAGQPLGRDDGAEGPRVLILLAERDPYAAEFAEFFLRTEGFEVVLALDAAEAERTSAERRPDLAVVEVMISGGTGAELCRRLKAQGVATCLAISALQAQDDAMAAGADAFLEKPLDPLRFVSTVKDLLGRSAFLRKGPEGGR